MNENTAYSWGDPLGLHAVRGGRTEHRPLDWRWNEHSLRHWDGRVLAAALAYSGLAVLLSGLIALTPLRWAAVLSLGALWVGLSVPVAVAFARGIPAGLLRFHPRDVVWGVCGGLALRVTQGYLSHANSLPFPSSLDGSSLGGQFLGISAGTIGSLVAPLFEEFFFRAVVLIFTFHVLRRRLGFAGAGSVAATFATLGFVGLHAVYVPLAGLDVAQLSLVAICCAVATLLTGRIWTALIIHLTYNASFLGLIAIQNANI